MAFTKVNKNCRGRGGKLKIGKDRKGAGAQYTCAKPEKKKRHKRR